MEKKKMTRQEAGRLGGLSNAERRKGTNFYKEIGKKGGSATSAVRGPEHYQSIGAKGGSVTSSRRTTEFYKEIGAKGGNARKRKKEEQA